MICRKCGELLEKGDIYCPACGHSVRSRRFHPPRSVLLLGLVLLLVLFGFTVGRYLVPFLLEQVAKPPSPSATSATITQNSLSPSTATNKPTTSTTPSTPIPTIESAPIKLTAPTLTAPVSGEMVEILTPVLQWTASPSATNYRIQIGSTEDFRDLLVNETTGTVASLVVPAGILTHDTTYYWRVRAGCAEGQSDWTAAFFRTGKVQLADAESPKPTETTQPTQEIIPIETPSISPSLASISPPPTPYLPQPRGLEPETGAIITDDQAILRWSPLGDIRIFRVQVSLEGDYSSPFVEELVLVNYLLIQLPVESNTLAQNTKYFWRIRAETQSDAGIWAESWFQYQTPKSTTQITPKPSPSASPTASPSTADYDIPSLKAQVTGFGFLIGPPGMDGATMNLAIDRGELSGPNITYSMANVGEALYWVLSLTYPAPGKRIQFQINQTMIRPPNSTSSMANEFYIEPDWTGSIYSVSFNVWSVGEHTVELRIDGILVAKGTVIVR